MSTGEARNSPKLYSPRMLALSAELANFPFNPASQLVAEARSRTCGSTIKLGIDYNVTSGVSKIGMQVAACAVGQSSAAVLARAISGKDKQTLTETVEQIEGWLGGDCAAPDWPDFDVLSGARSHPGRHGALLLPWNAALEALSSRNPAG
ncbi:iron-sulfur cluster assembly scaffold protein [uncultured Erythrobacter sp.]|uniref:iron-sulfur cluster assembly scaffold protein n=1 Tax=uncultured Erythrobacter sp. TaxID=263913 RepID=UPI00261C7AF3|nr:iron-sulfur cluster assembly scaffold protein [uncultured Erythrobacter sp.]